MQDLLVNPAVQSGLLPALAAAVAAALVGRTRALALVPIAGFAVVVWLAVGLTLEPMTARSKLVLAVFGAGAIALALDLLRLRASAAVRVLWAALIAAAAVWLAIRVLEQAQGAAIWSLGTAVVVWSVAMVEAMRATAGEPVRTLVAATVLGFAMGALGLLGASLSVAMMGIALGASCGVAVLALLWRGRTEGELWFVGLPVAVFTALGGLVASLTGELSGRALVPLVAVPLAVRLAPPSDSHRWRSAIIAAAAALVPAAIAVALAWWQAAGAATA